MLIEFNVRNYLSFKQNMTLSLRASNPIKELEGDKNELNNVFYDFDGKTKYLKSAVLYGANGSGKSNLVSAIGFFRDFILKSSNDRQADDEIKTIPFLFSSETDTAPSSFEIVFTIERSRYRYGFEATNKIVTAEWLFVLDSAKSNKESNYFTRELGDIDVNTRKFKEGKGIETKTRSNALFLSTVAQLNGEISIRIQNWFKNNLNIISGLHDIATRYTANRLQKDPTFRKKLIDFIRLINLGIEDIRIEEKEFESLFQQLDPPKKEKDEKLYSLISELQKEIQQRAKTNAEIKEITINAYHKKYDQALKYIEDFALDFSLESEGTQKLFSLLGPWFETLEKGEVLIVDELDARLHTKLTSELLKIFHSKINNKNAQLIFASHDTNLLRSELFRRDQIWFTEKNSIGATDLYSLVEYRINQATSVRNDASFEKDYLIGKYGAIPYFGDVSKFINDFANGPE